MRAWTLTLLAYTGFPYMPALRQDQELVVDSETDLTMSSHIRSQSLDKGHRIMNKGAKWGTRHFD